MQMLSSVPVLVILAALGMSSRSAAAQCPPVDPCGGAAPTASVTFNASGDTEPSVAVNGGPAITIGTSTRADVESQLGVGVLNDPNPIFTFPFVYCDAGVVLDYVGAGPVFDTTSPR